jgi:hypothetical protein
MERWRDIPSLNGKFEASVTGLIRNKKSGKYREPYINENGYLCVGIYDSEKGQSVQHRVHRLVAEAFIPNPDGKRTVNHIDGNKLNNNVENLEWATHSENLEHARRTGLKPTTDKQRRAASENLKINRLKAHPWKRCYLIDLCGHKMEFPSIKSAAIYVDGCPSAIVLCCQCKKKTYKGFRWGYC